MTMTRPLFLQVTSSHPAYLGMVMDHGVRHQAYCKKWDYDFLIETPKQMDGPWTRLESILKHLRRGVHSHVFCLDADVFIADFSHDLREMTPSWAYTAFTIHPYPWGHQGVFHLQCGGYSFRTCLASIAFVERILKGRQFFPDDQTIVNQLMIGPEGDKWQQGLRVLPCEWNQTIQNCDFKTHPPIIAAFHGTQALDGNSSPEFRRELMRKVALDYPYKKEGA